MIRAKTKENTSKQSTLKLTEEDFSCNWQYRTPYNFNPRTLNSCLILKQDFLNIIQEKIKLQYLYFKIMLKRYLGNKKAHLAVTCES